MDSAIRQQIETYRVLFKTGRYEEAADAALRIVGEHGYDADGIPEARWRLDIGVALLRARRTEEGERQVRIAASLDPENPRAHYKHGLALARLRRSEEAIDAFRRAVSLYRDPELIATASTRLEMEEARVRKAMASRRD